MPRSLYCIYIISVIVSSCNQKNPEDHFYDIVNQNFLNFVDTAAYTYGAFIMVSGSKPASKQQPSEFTVLVNSNFESADKLIPDLNSLLANDIRYKDYSVLTQQKSSSIFKIDIQKIKNTGKYKLKNVEGIVRDETSIGEVIFFTPLIKGERAIIFVSIYVDPKAGYTSAFLLRKIQNHWKILEKVELSVW